MIQLPGSKSISQRALIFASLCQEETELVNVNECEDVIYLINALKDVGVSVKKDGNYFVKGGRWVKPDRAVFFGDNATGAKLFAAACLVQRIELDIEGSERLKVRLSKDQNFNELPKSILPANVSSQGISAALLVLAGRGIGGEISLSTFPVSRPYIDLTIKVLEDFGMKVFNEEYVNFKIPKKQKWKSPKKYFIEPDLSAAAPFLAWSMISGKEVEFENLPTNSTQADAFVLKNFEDLGAKVSENKFIPPLKIENSWNEVNGNDFPDGVISLTMLAPFLKTPTTFKNIKHLSWKESDRLKAIAENFAKLGVKVEQIDNFIIYPGINLEAQTLIDTKNDHRIAMNFAALSTKIPGLKILDFNCVKKSFPNFWSEFTKASGKTFRGFCVYSQDLKNLKLAEEIAAKNNLPFYDFSRAYSDIYDRINYEHDGKIQESENLRLANKEFFAQIAEKPLGVYFTKDKNSVQAFETFCEISYPDKKHIIFIGSRGTGKTVLGKLLAEKLNLPFVDLDEENHEALSALVNEKISWIDFREDERRVLEKILLNKASVIATGGGTAESQTSRELIKDFAKKIIYLNSKPEHIKEHLEKRKDKPNYQNLLEEDMARRHKLYSPIADIEIFTYPWNEGKLLNEILCQLQNNYSKN